MMAAPPPISVVICAYSDERWDNLRAVVASLRQQTIPPHEIVLVIDHNERLALRVRVCIPGVVLVENSGPRGLSGARNSGIAAATGAVIAFIDDDAYADERWLEHLGAAYADPTVAGAGGAIAPTWPRNRPAWFPPEFDWVVGCTYRGMAEEPAAVRNLIGCNMSFRRDVFAAVGLFDSGLGRVGTLPVGCEETELCIRLRQQRPDWQLLYLPAALVHHSVTPARATWRYFARRCYSEGISKAQVVHLVGGGDGLSSERDYTFKTLPQGVWRGCCDTLRGDLGGPARALAISAGLLLTAAGYLRGKMARRGPVAQGSRYDVAVNGSARG